VGAARKVRIGGPDTEMSAYSVLTIICLFAGNSGGESRAGQLLINAVTVQVKYYFTSVEFEVWRGDFLEKRSSGQISVLRLPRASRGPVKPPASSFRHATKIRYLKSVCFRSRQTRRLNKKVLFARVAPLWRSSERVREKRTGTKIFSPFSPSRCSLNKYGVVPETPLLAWDLSDG
jgi:hypothetical protein